MGFSRGQQVVYDYDNRIGTITGQHRGDRWQVKFSDGENRYIPESKLLEVSEEDIFSSFQAGCFQGIEDLRRIMYKHRLSGELTNILYSMSNRATRFMPHQFIPVTKFLESYTDRLLIANEVGLGKTIESMYIWEELRARKNAKRLLIVVPSILRLHRLSCSILMMTFAIIAHNRLKKASLASFTKSGAFFLVCLP